MKTDFIDSLTPEIAHTQAGLIRKLWKLYSKREETKEQILV
jgi:hypothetical protein